MRKLANQLLYSPSDLITYMESPFDSWMERRFVEFPNEIKPDARDESHEVLAKHGNVHERSFLQQLEEEGRDIAVINGSTEEAELATIVAMKSGREIIYQGYLTYGNFAGLSDFLVKVAGKSELGDFHYEVWDTKLAKKAKPYFIVQLSCYAEMLENIQGRLPSFIRVVLGDRTQKEFKTQDYFHHYLQLKQSFLEFQSRFSKDQPMEDCVAGTFSRWSSVSEKILEEQDHLLQVANIRKNQIERLKKAGINTMTELSENMQTSIPNVAQETFETLKHQAQLQVRTKRLTPGSKPLFEILQAVDGKGMSLLPPASPGDVYFDMEGYPHMEGGLEYLFGVVHEPEEQAADAEQLRYEFADWWAHDRDQEKIAFEQFIDWIYARWQKDPGMHIYHYAPYEVSAVRRLAGRHATRIEEVDNLLRQEIFVDLYQIVRQALRIGEPSYSIKYVEHLYREKRSGAVAKATDSVVSYERWIEDSDGPTFNESRLLKEIRDYNEEDCVSTLQLAKWLRKHQEEAGIGYTGRVSEAPPVAVSASESALLAAELVAEAETISDPETKRVQLLLAGLLEFHKREDKPMWWRMFDRKQATFQELYEDLDCLAGIKRTDTPPFEVKRSLGYEYSFDPDQDTKLDVGPCKTVHDFDSKRIVDIDRRQGLITLAAAGDKEMPDECSLMVDEYVPSEPMVGSILKICELWHARQILPPCLSELLFRREPRIQGRFTGDPVAPSYEVHDVSAAISKMQNSCLSIQGPPGTGKTYTASHSIVELLRQGKRVGITSNSHKAIENLLNKVAELANQQGVHLDAAKIGNSDKNGNRRSTEPGVKYYNTPNDFFEKAEIDDTNLIAGTAWFFSRGDVVNYLDYLFIDEAGQVSLANVTAMSRSTHNLVLLGDQMQLEQPIQGSHPGECGQSCLEYLLQDNATIPENLGVFLGTTRRMHPDICSLISDAVYDGRLNAHQDNRNQILHPPADVAARFPKRAGIVWLPVEHRGNAQASDQEVDVIEKLINDLLTCRVADKSGNTKPIAMSDILIVTPYNMQVRKIAQRIPGARVASVDKFQGQEAPIVILSMCASEGSSSPRGIDFLFSRNRLNVALSRAKTLAFVVASPELLKTPCTSLKQMKLVSFFCWIVKAGKSSPNEIRNQVVRVS